jgi:hypothetical protein
MTQNENDFIPSAKPAQYEAQFIPVETTPAHLIEDDQMFTEWFNPTDRQVILQIHVGTDPKNAMWRQAFNAASPAKRLEMKSGVRIIIVKPGETKSIDSEYDLAIQRTRCLHPQCSAKRDACKDIDHPRVVTSGLAPQLICKRWKKVPRLDANLDQARAQTEAAIANMAIAQTKQMAAELEVQEGRRLLEEAQRAAREALEAKARLEERIEKEMKARLEAETKLQQSAEATKQQKGK